MPDMARSRPDDRPALPGRAGVGLKPSHVEAILAEKPEIGFFEAHPENYMGDGGQPHHDLARIRRDYPLSLHGVGLSIGGARPLDRAHLERLRALVDRYEPASFSEHLAWSTHDVGYLNDLLPLPYTEESVSIVADHVDAAQEALGRSILIENPATYLAFIDSSKTEIEFLQAVARRTGCGLLLDVNNVFVCANNHGFDPYRYIDAFPVGLVGEVHLAGHATEEDESGDRLLIDTHDRPVADPVWGLYTHLIAGAGPLPTLIEWDSDVPAWPILKSQAAEADRMMLRRSRPEQRRAGAR